MAKESMKNKGLDDFIKISYLNSWSCVEWWTAEALASLCLTALSGLAHPKAGSIDKWTQN